MVELPRGVDELVGDAGAIVLAALARFDLTLIWVIALTALGYAVAGKSPKGKAIGGAVAAYEAAFSAAALELDAAMVPSRDGQGRPKERRARALALSSSVDAIVMAVPMREFLTAEMPFEGVDHLVGTEALPTPISGQSGNAR